MEPNKKSSHKKIIGIAVIVVIAIATLLIVTKPWGADKQSPGVNSGWNTYKATKYGFKFDYPKEWGSPTLNNYSQAGVSGYNVMFTPNQAKYTVMAIMESPGSSKTSGPVVDKKFIQNSLSAKKSKFFKSDGSSYSTVLVDPKTKAPGQINIYQIISLPNIHVTAVNTELIISPQAGCPSDDLTDNANRGCVTNTIYNEASRFSKSISPI